MILDCLALIHKTTIYLSPTMNLALNTLTKEVLYNCKELLSNQESIENTCTVGRQFIQPNVLNIHPDFSLSLIQSREMKTSY